MCVCVCLCFRSIYYILISFYLLLQSESNCCHSSLTRPIVPGASSVVTYTFFSRVSENTGSSREIFDFFTMRSHLYQVMTLVFAQSFVSESLHFFLRYTCYNNNVCSYQVTSWLFTCLFFPVKALWSKGVCLIRLILVPDT